VEGLVICYLQVLISNPPVDKNNFWDHGPVGVKHTLNES
jgi:hypothetical protein